MFNFTDCKRNQLWLHAGCSPAEVHVSSGVIFDATRVTIHFILSEYLADSLILTFSRIKKTQDSNKLSLNYVNTRLMNILH